MLKLLKRIGILFVTISLVVQVFKYLFSVWTSPFTWTTGLLVTAAKLNEQLRDNLIELKDPPTDLVNLDEADFTTTSDTFAIVDDAGNPDLSLTITTSGGDVLVSFSGALRNTNAGGGGALNFTVDGVAFAAEDGIVVVGNAITIQSVAFSVWVQSLAAASHTFKLTYKRTGAAGTLELFAGGGTAGADIHAQFAAREVS